MAHLFAPSDRLRALVVAIKHSAIVVACVRNFRPSAQLGASDWATIRNSPDVDRFILEWIASHVDEAGGRRRLFSPLF